MQLDSSNLHLIACCQNNAMFIPFDNHIYKLKNSFKATSCRRGKEKRERENFKIYVVKESFFSLFLDNN